MALASLTASYSDSEGEGEDDRSETPEMDVECEVELPEQTDAIEPSENDKTESTEKISKIESTEESATIESSEEPTKIESSEEPTKIESSEEPIKIESPEEPTNIHSSEEPFQIETPQEASQIETPEEASQIETPEGPTEAESSEETNKTDLPQQTKKRKLSTTEDLGPILGPHPKEEESWSYKGLLDFSKTKSDNPETTEEETEPNPASSQDVDPSCYSYEGEVCIYTDPESGGQYVWDDSSSEWMPREDAASDVTKNYVYDGNTYWYKDQAGTKYRWNNVNNEWESVMADCPLPASENSGVMGPTLPEERPKLNDSAAYANLLVDTAPAIRSKVSGDRAARQLNHYMDYEAFERQANIGFEKPKFTKKQIQLLRRRKQEKKYKKSLEWLKKDY